MKSSDKDEIMAILRSTPAFVAEDVAIAEEVIDAYLGDPRESGYHFYVAEDEGHVVAYISYGATPLTRGTWDIYWLATAPNQRGKGIGSTLLKFAEADIKNGGGRMVLIETAANPTYELARRLYQTHGYEIISTVPDFYDPGDAKLTFRKYL
jgi:ribosomal protein S18 acetylase RimI-like enzyme